MDDLHSQASELMVLPSINDDADLDRTCLRVRRKYSTEEWKAKKPFIKEFYVDNNGTLNDLMKELSEKHNFHPTRKMFKDKFEQWGFAKNITKKNVRCLLGHETLSDPARSVSKLGVYGRPVERQRLAKFLKRKKLSPADSLTIDDGSAEVDHATQMSDTSTTSIAAEDALDSFAIYPNQHDTTPVDSCYEQACHYRPWKKKFRLVETFPDGETYIGDSFGYHSYIDVNQERSCTSLCFCRKHSISEAFTFVVYKLPDQMSISINSNALYAELIALVPLDDISLQLCFPERRINGLELLKHYQTLITRLKDLQSEFHHNPVTQDLVLEFGLLVDGLLGDGQVFKSFSYEKLYESGVLDYQLYKYFQQQRFDKDITTLDDGFCNIDDEEGVLMPDSTPTSTTLDQKRRMDGPTQNWSEFAVEIANDPDRSSLQKSAYHSIRSSSEALRYGDDLHERESCLGHDDARSQSFTVTQHGDGSIPQSLLDYISDVDRVRRSTAHSSGTISLSESASPLPERINQLFVNYEVVDPSKKGLYLLFAIASKTGHEGIAQWLHSCIVDPNRESYDLLSAGTFRAGHEGNARRLPSYNMDLNGGTFDLPLVSAARAGFKEIVQLLLDRGADPNKQGSIRPLIGATSAGHKRIVKLLLDRGADLNECKFWTSDSPLYHAVTGGHERIVKLFLDHSAHPNEPESWTSLLSSAATRGYEGIVRLLLDRGADPNGRTFWVFDSPLYHAVTGGHERIVKLFLDHSAHPNEPESWTSLLSSAATRGYEGIVRLLLDRGADPNEYTFWTSVSPLYDAVTGGHEGIVKLLLDYSAHPSKSESWTSLLSSAATRGCEGIVRLLLDRSADPNECIYGTSDSPLYDAVTRGHEGVVKLLLDYSAHPNKPESWTSLLPSAVTRGYEGIVRLLLDHGADPNKSKSWTSPLYSAVTGGHEGIVRLLLDHGAYPNKSESWISLLSSAVIKGHEVTVKLLLDHGADPNISEYRTSQLFNAVFKGHEGIVKLLLDYGADPSKLGSWTSQLSNAVIKGHEGIVKLLLSYGADPNKLESWTSLLSSAVTRGYEGIVMLLLDYGAHPNKWESWTSLLSIAVIKGHEGIVELLLGLSAKVGKEKLHLPKYTTGVGSRGTAEQLPHYWQDLGQDDYHSLLTGAAGAGNEKFIKLLLDNGADINAITSDGLALSVAVKSRRATTVKFLIKEGANIQLAALYLQDREDARWLFTTAASTWGQQTTNSSKSENLRYLRLKFVNQYMMMVKVAQNSFTKLRDLPTRFRNYKEVWTAGIGTLRGLRRGDTPRDVYETIAFLLIARSIVETLRNKKNGDYFEEFQMDLRRWEVVFDGADLEAYRDAMTSMWDIDFNAYLSNQRIDDEDLFRLQELASTLLSRANDLLDFDGLDNGGLEHSQRRWRENTGQPQCANVPNILSNCQIPRTSDLPPEEVVPPLPPDPPIVPSTSALGARIKDDLSPFEPVVLLLIVGAIFAIIIIFLQVLRQISTSFHIRSVKTYQDRYWILATYMGFDETTTQKSSPIMLENDLFTTYDSFFY